jgi:hypothetical protein
MAQTHEAERASVHMQHELESMQQRMSALAATQRSYDQFYSADIKSCY